MYPIKDGGRLEYGWKIVQKLIAAVVGIIKMSFVEYI